MSPEMLDAVGLIVAGVGIGWMIGFWLGRKAGEVTGHASGWLEAMEAVFSTWSSVSEPTPAPGADEEPPPF